MREAKGKVTQQTCDDAKKMLTAGMKQEDVGRILGVDASTISKIKKGNYILEEYLEVRRKTNKAQQEKQEKAEDQIQGQIQMELPAEKPEMSDQTKLMRFQASQIDKLAAKLDAIIAKLNIITQVSGET